jgi:hypothetical protein
MSPAEVAAARAYLAPIVPAYWEWDADHSAIAWRDGPTITVRQELAIALSSQAQQGLPPLSAVLILLSACRDSWSESRTVLTDIVESMSDADMYLPAWTGELFQSLDRVHSVSRTLLQTPQRKADLVAYLFGNQADREIESIASTAIVKLLAAAGPVSQLEGVPPEPFDVGRVIGTLRSCLRDFDPQVFESWVKTGLTQSVQPAEVELTAGERVRALLTELNDHQELGGVARLARQLLAAITLPRPLAEPDDLPLGGVSDITNRGALDRLLLSELAHDDLTLAVRVAMNEALYYRRETPPRSPPLRRTIVLDSGLRTWGVPRLFTTAIGLALSAAGDEQLTISTFRASGEQLRPVDLTRQPGLAEHLAALETDLHLGRALPAIEQEFTQTTSPSDVVLITSDDALADEDFRKQLRASDLHGSWIATINREGRFRLLEFGQREMVLKREATFDLQAILTPPQKPVAPLFVGDKTLPAFCRLQSCPLRIPHDLAVEKAWSIGDEGVLAIFKDQRLTWWDNPQRPPRILHEAMPARGRVLWADSASAHPPFRAVVGTMSNRGLHAIQVWPHEARVVRAALKHDYSDHFSTVHGTAEHIFLIGPKRVVAFAWTGEELATSTSFTQHISGQYFCCGGPRFIGAITCEGGRIGLTSGYATPHGYLPGVTAVLGSSESPYALMQQGYLGNLLKGTIEPLKPLIDARPFVLKALSRDGRRAIVYGKDARYWRVGVDPAECTQTWGDSRQILETKLEKFLNRQINLRQNFRGIYVTARGELALVSKKGQEVTIVPSPQLVLRDTGRSQVREPTLRLFSAMETKTGYSLQKASWDDGSEAWLDSRGLLHLRSSSLNVPELTIVLHEGHTAAWNATGAVCGNSYFTGEEGRGMPTYALHPMLNSFLASLVTVETT